MKVTRDLMGMPITVEVVDVFVKKVDIDNVFRYFTEIDERFSTYKDTSEISAINRGELDPVNASPEMREVFEESEQTKIETNGYFEIFHHGQYDPSGLVKGWAIWNAAAQLKKAGFKNFFVDAGSDIQVFGHNAKDEPWRVGIKHPFQQEKIVKVLELGHNEGVATSGDYLRGNHIYDPIHGKTLREIVSLTVIGPNIYEADRFATAAFAMGKEGIQFIESQPSLEGYMIDRDGQATFTSGFPHYVFE